MDSTTLSRAGSQMMTKNASMANLQSKPLNFNIDNSPERPKHGLDLFGTNKLHKLSVQETVNVAIGKGDIFGIQGYNLPRMEHPVKLGTQNCFPKEKGKNFVEVAANLTKLFPGPGEYKTVPKWGCIEKKVNPTKKNTYIDQIFKNVTETSPAKYPVDYKRVEPRIVGGSKTMSQGVNFLSDTEYLGSHNPSPAYKDCNPDSAKIKTLGRCRSVVTFKNEKAKPKEWKIQKTTLPGPGAHVDAHKAFNLTLPTSPIVKFKTGKRIIFAEAAARQKGFVPSPSAYTFKDFKENKIWKNVTTKRQ